MHGTSPLSVTVTRTHAAALGLLLTLGGTARAEDKSAVSPNHLKLPDGPGSIEGVGENVRPNYSMGLMTWGMDLAVPEGFPGVTPKVRLSYSSGEGRSTAGLGWSIAFPSIERATVHGLPRYTVDDEFSADGAELVLVGTAGGNRVYRARFEGSFIRYTWVEPSGRDYWMAELPDGTVRFFGADRAGAVAPLARESGPEGTFRYRVVDVTDPFDNVLHHEYVQSGGASLVSRITYVFLDNIPRYEILFRYEDREDHLQDGKPGFPIIINKRLDDVLVRARGMQRRRYDLLYQPYATSGGLTRLSGVRTYGTDDAEAYGVKFDFSYSNQMTGTCSAPGCFSPRVVRMNGSVGPGLLSGTADLVDLNGDSLPDVLDTDNGAHRVYVNTPASAGVPSFAEAITIPGASAALASPGVRMVDLDGDGFADLYDAQNGVIHHGTGNLQWRTEAVTFTAPNMGPGSNFTFTDVDGDKQVDILYADGTDTYFLRNTDGRFSTTPTPGDDLAGEFETTLEAGITTGLQLADMTGDGLADAVFVASGGLVAYRTSYGRGRFSTAVTEMTGLQPATIPGDLKLVDLNGDGLSDAVLVRPGAVSISINRNGTAFHPAQEITGDGSNAIPMGTSAEVQVRFADMTADGSVDVVWVDASGNVTYLDLYQVRPNLLARIDNGIGKFIDVQYGSVVDHMLRDGGASAWRYRLPHPMLTVDRIDTWDNLSNQHAITDMAYRDGFYDGVEDRFRGFERVTVLEQGDDSIENGRITMEFDVGAMDAYRNGLMVFEQRESEGPGGWRILNHVRNTYTDCDVTGVPTTTPRVRFICPQRKDTTHVEGRPAAEHALVREEYTHDGYGNQVLKSLLGVVSMGGGACGACNRPDEAYGEPCGMMCLGDERFEETLLVPPTGTGGRWMLNKPMVKSVFGRAGDAFRSEEHHLYDGEEFVGLPLGQLTRGLVSRVSARENAGQERFIDTQRTAYNARGLPRASLDANGHRRTIEHDAHGLLATAEVLHLDDAGHEPYQLRMELELDPVQDAITGQSNWFIVGLGAATTRHVTRMQLDRFGRRTALASPGDTLDSPTLVDGVPARVTGVCHRGAWPEHTGWPLGYRQGILHGRPGPHDGNAAHHRG